MQSSLAARAHQKLAYCFFEPFHVLAWVNSVAYKLELPDHSSIHPVFHVSQLNRVIGDGNQVTPVLPNDFAMKLSPEQVLQTRTMAHGPHHVQQILINRNNLPLSLATWKI